MIQQHFHESQSTEIRVHADGPDSTAFKMAPHNIHFTGNGPNHGNQLPIYLRKIVVFCRINIFSVYFRK